MFSVTTDELLEQKDEAYCKIDPESEWFKALSQEFVPKNIPKKVMEKYGFLLGEISRLIESIFGELHLALECILISLIYLERLILKSKVELRTGNWRPLLLTSIILAAKYWEDCCFWNFDFNIVYSELMKDKGTAFPQSSINWLESQFLTQIEFDLYVSTKSYKQYYKQVDELYHLVRKQEDRQRRKDEYRKFGFIKSKKSKKSTLLI